MTAYHQGDTASNYYAKPLPLTTAVWATDAVVGVQNGTTGSFAFATDSSLPYVVYERAGASPATSDEPKATIPASASTGLGTGARTVTPTVLVAGDPLEGATVRLTLGADTYTGTTDADGEVASFNLEDGTYTVAISKPGYTFAGTTLVVDGDETPEYTMTAVGSTAADAPYCLTTIPILTQVTENAVGVEVRIDFLRFLSGATKEGVIVNDGVKETSDSSGNVIVRLARLARYRISYKVGFEPEKLIEFSTPDEGTLTVTEP